MQLRRHFSRIFAVQKFTVAKAIAIALILSVGSLLCLSYYVFYYMTHTQHQRKTEIIVSQQIARHFPADVIPVFNVTSPLKIDKRVLLLVETHYTQQCRDIMYILQYCRFRYKVELAGKNLPNLTHREKGKFSLVIFERFESYLNMDKWNKELLDKYCKAFNVGIVAFTYPEQVLFNAQAKGFPISVHSQLTLKDYEVNPVSPVLRITKSGVVFKGNTPGTDWTIFQYKHKTYTPIAWAKVNATAKMSTNKTHQNPLQQNFKYATAVFDKGLYDGIKRVIFGHHLQFWLHKLLLVDVLYFLSNGKLNISMERYLLIDIDDIFVGRSGVRMTRHDVQVRLFDFRLEFLSKNKLVICHLLPIF